MNGRNAHASAPIMGWNFLACIWLMLLIDPTAEGRAAAAKQCVCRSRQFSRKV